MPATLTDQQLLSEVQGLLAETENSGASWSSGMWTPAEAVGYLNDRQENILVETAPVITRTTIGTVPMVNRVTLPSGWIATLRAAWVRASDSRVFPLHRADEWELDSILPGWRTDPGVPAHYTDADVPTLTVQLAPAPAVAGTLRLHMLTLPTQFTGAGVASTLPAEVGPGLVWGTIERMLSKEGRARDLTRAQIARQHYDLSLEGVRLLLSGWGE